MITTGEYGGIAGLKHVYRGLGVEWADDREASRVLELVQYANAHNQKPLLDDELLVIARYPDQVRKLLTMAPDLCPGPFPVIQRQGDESTPPGGNGITTRPVHIPAGFHSVGHGNRSVLDR